MQLRTTEANLLATAIANNATRLRFYTGGLPASIGDAVTGNLLLDFNISLLTPTVDGRTITYTGTTEATAAASGTAGIFVFATTTEDVYRSVISNITFSPTTVTQNVISRIISLTFTVV